MGRVPTKEQAQRILARKAEREDELSRQLKSILAIRSKKPEPLVSR